jgi:3-methyladenine DNA glycosylase AlkC
VGLVSAKEPTRRGALRMADVSPEIKAAIERGEEETRTLAEMLVADFAALLKHLSPRTPEAVLQAIRSERSVTKRMPMCAAALGEAWGSKALSRMMAHRSDLVRGWGAYLLAQRPGLTLGERYALVRVLADDGNAGVREWAWIALRPRVIEAVDEALVLGETWVHAPEANVRRFAVEILRPRGVWCAHLPALRAKPSRGLVVLEPLKAEMEKYVQDSVANWLNDASKDDPTWVRKVCRRWEKESSRAATARIVKRAMRTLNASGA